MDFAVTYGSQALVAIVILVIGWTVSKWASGLVHSWGRRVKADEALVRFLSSIGQYAVLAATIIAALARLGVETTSVVAIFASAGFAIGLALQGSLANFASGVLILFFRPFNLGDKVVVSGELGDVSDIGLFATMLVTADNKTIIVPNGAVTGGTIVNITSNGTLRGSIDFGVAYGTDLSKAMAVAVQAAGSVDLVLQEPGPACAFTEMGASSLNFQVHCWCKPADYLAMLHEVRLAVYNALDAEGIEIPFDQVVMHQAQ
jgi:small conductance mechanosensitive channel